MASERRSVVLWSTMLLALWNVTLGWLVRSMFLAGAGACGLCYVVIRMLWRLRPEVAPPSAREPNLAVPPEPATVRFPARENDPTSLVRQMLAQGRYTLLLRPQIAASLVDAQFAEALDALEKAMALVPDGEVVLGQIDEALEDGRLDDAEIAASRGRVVAVQRFFLDRHLVTNRQYFEFVAAGGYEQGALWDEAVLPAVLDFVDSTGQPGPRSWKDGWYLPGREDHPVVGVSWYEASAYARWVGKRLPSDAEWVKAASWPVQVSATSRMQRKYPWGDTMDRRRANLWGSGPGTTVPVTENAEGVSVGGVRQMIGNVWEWTSSNFRTADHPNGPVVLDVPMKSLRGGAFDTYFDVQATCHFQSGESLLGRKPNVGFRCAVGVCDVLLAREKKTSAPEPLPEPEDSPPAAVEEVTA